MLDAAVRFPAVLLFRAKGTIMFANPPAIEQTGLVTGATPSRLGTLDGLLDRLFPAAPARAGAAQALTRAMRVARRRGQVCLQVALAGEGRHPDRWDVRITPQPGHSEETYQMSFQPAPDQDPGDLGALVENDIRVLRTAATHARRILDRALTVIHAPSVPQGPGTDLDTLLALMARARGLLATLEDTPPEHP